MAADPRGRKSDSRARGRSLANGVEGPSRASRPRKEDLAGYPDLGALKRLLRTDGDLLDPAQKAALEKAISLIDSVHFEGYGAYCELCKEAVPTGVKDPQVPVRCYQCVFWSDRMVAERVAAERDLPSAMSIRAGGLHYIAMPAGIVGGPVMTVTFKNGIVLVTRSLRLQGPVPDNLRDLLPDNAYIQPGRPANVPEDFEGHDGMFSLPPAEQEEEQS